MEKSNAVKQGSLLKNAVLVLAAVSPMLIYSTESLAAIADLDVSAGATYLETNASDNMSNIATVLFSLAGLAVAIRWVKATFFS